MRTLDINNNEIFNFDENLGYIIEEQIVSVHHEAKEPVEEQGEYVTIAEYENGGKEVEWVIKVPGEPGHEAYDEYETILRYYDYTQEELDRREINNLKQNLAQTDYISAKLGDSLINSYTLNEVMETIISFNNEYAAQVELRKQWRARINELEDKYKEQA